MLKNIQFHEIKSLIIANTRRQSIMNGKPTNNSCKPENNEHPQEKVSLKSKQLQESMCEEPLIQLKQQKIRNSIIKSSPNLEEYLNEFIKDRKAPSFTMFNQNFKLYGINVLPDSIKPLPVQLQQEFTSKNHRIVQYIVRMSYFMIRVKIFNTIEEDNYNFNFTHQISHGMYGTVFQIPNPFDKFKPIAIKKIRYQNYSLVSIQNAVKEYAIMKLLAGLQVGPPLVRLFGYDIVVSTNYIMFSMEKGISINNWIMKNLNKEYVEKEFVKLEQSLVLIHDLHICHNDIKPSNIIYSPQLDKLVYIDFGFSEIKIEGIGYMGVGLAKGSLYYCSDQMKNLFLTTGVGFIDTYFNDYVCLKKSKEYMLNNYLYTEPQQQDSSSNVSNSYFESIEKPSFSALDSFSSVITICIKYLIQQNDIQNFSKLMRQQSWIYPYVEINLRTICLFFLQVDPSLSLWNFFTKFCDLFTTESIFMTHQVKRMIDSTLKPYFKAFLQTNFCPKFQPNFIFQDQILQKTLIRRYNKSDLAGFILNEKQIDAYNRQENQLDLTEEDEQKLQPFFRKIQHLNYVKHRQIVELLVTVTSRRKFWYLVSDTEINMFRKCFVIADIKVSLLKVKEKSQYGVCKAYLIFFGRFLKFMHQHFNLSTIFSRVIKQFYDEVKPIHANQSVGRNHLQLDTNIQVEQQHNRFEILQLYTFLAERIFENNQNILPYESSLRFVKNYINVFDNKLIQCLKIKENIVDREEFQGLDQFFNAILKKYLMFRYEACLRAFVLSYYQMDYKNLVFFHKSLFGLNKWIQFQKHKSFIQNLFKNNFVLPFVEDFSNLIIFSDLIPVTLERKYSLVKRFEHLSERGQRYFSVISSDYLKTINFNIKMKLLSMYVSGKRIERAIQIANSLIDENLIAACQYSFFLVQWVFHLLNDSKKSKLIRKKLQNYHFNQLISFDNGLSIQNALMILQQQSSKKQDHLRDNFKESYLRNIKTAWNKCLTGQSYKNKYSQKFYLMKQILLKLVSSKFQIRNYIVDYERQLLKYDYYLQEKYASARQIQIFVPKINGIDDKQYPKIQVLYEQEIIEASFNQKQQMVKFVLGFHNKITEKQLIEELWQKYQPYYHQMEKELSQQPKQFHLSMICNYNEYLVGKYHAAVQAIKRKFQQMKQSFPESWVPQFTDYQSSQKSSQSVNFDSVLQYQSLVSALKKSRQNLKISVERYLKMFDKQLLDNDYYMIILIALRTKTLQLECHSVEKTNSQIKEFFYFLHSKNQIYFFFYFNNISSAFLTQVLQVAGDELFAIINLSTQACQKEGSPDQSQFSQRKLSSYEGHQSFSEPMDKSPSIYFYSAKSQAKNSLKTSSQIMRGEVFLLDVFYSLLEFIKDNFCVSYSQFIVNISLQIKHILIKNRHQTVKSTVNRLINYLELRLIKKVNETEQKNNLSILLLLVLSTARVDFGLKIKLFNFFLSKVKSLQNSSKELAKQAFFLLYYQYELNYHTNQEQYYQKNHDENGQEPIKSIIQEQIPTNTPIKASRINYLMVQLFRSYKEKRLLIEGSKYLDSLVKSLKSRINVGSSKSLVYDKFSNKIQAYINCNVEQTGQPISDSLGGSKLGRLF